MSQGPRRTQAATCHQLLSVPLILPLTLQTGLSPSLNSKNLTLPSFPLPLPALPAASSLPSPTPPDPSFSSAHRAVSPADSTGWLSRLEHTRFPVVCSLHPNPCHCFSSSLFLQEPGGSCPGPMRSPFLPRPAPCPQLLAYTCGLRDTPSTWSSGPGPGHLLREDAHTSHFCFPHSS